MGIWGEQKFIKAVVFVSHRFVLSSTESSSGAEPVIHFSGLSTDAVASGLKPFTQYTAVLEVGGANSCWMFVFSFRQKLNM